MKKLSFGKLFLIIVVCLFLLPFCANGETLPVPDAYPDVLRDGDTLHVLWKNQTELTVEDHSMPQHKIENGCYRLQDGVLVACDRGCSSILGPNQAIYEYGEYQIPRGFVITPQNITYAIAADASVYRWTPKEDQCWTYLCKLDMESLGDARIFFEFYAGTESTLYASLTWMNDEGMPSGTLYAFDLLTGKGQLLGTFPSIGNIAIGSDNTLLLQAKMESDSSLKRYVFDLNTMKARKLNDGTSKYGGSAFMPSRNGGWYTVGRGAIVHISQDGTETKICDIPASQYVQKISLSMDESTAYFAADGYLSIYRLQEKQPSRAALTIAGVLPLWVGDTVADSADFCNEHQADVIFSDILQREDALAQAMLLGDDTFDLMLIDLQDTDIAAFMQKGYAVDLSARREISAYMEQLYPVWTDACSWQGKVMAFPVAAIGHRGFEYNRIFWEEEALGDLPATYAELFDCIERWDAEGVLEVYSLFGTRESSYERLLWRILLDYVAVSQRQDEQYTFHQEKLITLLQRLEEIKPILDRHDAMHVTGDPLIYADGEATRIKHRIPTIYTEDYVPLSLSLWSGEEPTEPVFLYVMMINPHSPRQELALDYLAYLAEHPTGWAQCVMMQGQPDGIQEGDSALAKKQHEDEMAELQAELEKAEEQRDWDMVAVWREEMNQVQQQFQLSWEIMPTMTDKLYAVTPYWAVLTREGYGFLERDAETSLAAYKAGRTTLSDFLKNLDNILQMKRMEQQ